MSNPSQNLVTFNIQRFNPDTDKAPYWQSYEFDRHDSGAIMVLDGLLWIKDNLDESLSFRRSCGEGVCGSDGMNINGKNGLACITPIAEMTKVSLKPFPGMPVQRDLITDMTNFFKQHDMVEPYLQNSGPQPAKEYLQTPAERSKLDGLYECIMCGCCTSACPSHWWNPDKFAGPAALLQAARFIQDSRDDAKPKRLAQLNDKYKLFRCRSIMNCADVCPKGLNPTQAISSIRDEMLKEDT